MKQLFTTALLATFCGLSLQAQQVNLSTQFKNLKARSIGPSGMSGRITTIDALHADRNTIYLGAASGGVWKTTNGGASWNPIFDEQPIQNIGSLRVCQSNPSIVWVGTGEGNPRNSLNIGGGIYKSVDAGKTFTSMGLEKTRNVHRIIIDPNNPDVVYAGVIGNPYGVHPERGVFKTTDGGATWNKVLYTNDTSGVADMIMDSKNPNKLFAAMWQHSRNPWALNSGGKGSGLYVTLDAGKTWKNIAGKNGLPEMPYGRIGLTQCHDMPNRVYALIESKKSALYMSDDGGENWKKVNEDPQYTANRSFYFQEIFCDPKNENRVWLINQMIHMSEDGGKTFRTIVPYNGIHPDHHAFWIHPEDPNFIIEGNDGGIGITRDKGANWQFDEKLPVGQFYHVNVDNELPYNIMGGMQDNGSWRGPAYTWIDGGIRNYEWESLWGGDGFDVSPDPTDANWVYAMSQGGNLGRYHVPTGEGWQIEPPSTANTVNKDRLRFNWNAAFAQDRFDPNTIYYGSQFVHKSTNKGVSWTTISPDLTTNDSVKIDQSKNGGISIDITGAENHCTILAIDQSPLNKDVIWVSTDDGQVQVTKDGGKTWTNVTAKITGMAKGSWLPQIRAGRYNSNSVFVVANDYRRGNFAQMVYRSDDLGNTWTNILENKKTLGYALTVLQDPVEPNLIFVGTEQGLWVSMDNAATFQQFKNNYPSVSTFDLAIQEREADLAIATFGRALYVVDNIRPLRALAKNKSAAVSKLKTFEGQTAYQVTSKNQTGYEWSSWGLYDGDNKSRSAIINAYIPYSDSAKKSEKKDSLTVQIYDAQNILVRTFKRQADTGFNMIAWGMEAKGLRRPGSPKPKADAPEPGGMAVLPGTYKAVVQFKKEKDSVMVVVKGDPRKPDNSAIRIAQKQMTDRITVSSNKLTEGLDILTDAEDIVKKFDAQLKDVEDNKIADSIKKEGKKVTDEIKSIRDFINGKKIERQGYGQVPQETVMTAYQEAYFTIIGKNVAPGQQETLLVEKAEKQIAAAVEKVNKFVTGKWKAYQALVEGNKVNIFKEFKPL